MNLRTIGIIIRREYLNKVRKKSFLITTLLVPILVGGGMVAMMYIMMNTKGQMKKVAVVDLSGIVMPKLENTETINFIDYSGLNADSVKTRMTDFELDAVLSISDLLEDERSVNAEITSLKPLGVEVAANISNMIDNAIEAYRVDSYDIEGLNQIMEDIKSNIKLKSYTMDKQGKETISETGVYAIVSMLLGIVIFLFITLFGSMVMSAVIEEKSSRVIEVLISSVKATELMFGKIIGVALVAITQFILWAILTGALISVAGSAFGMDKLQKIASPDAAGMVSDMSSMDLPVKEIAEQSEVGMVMSTLQNMPAGKMAVAFLLFFVFGYMLYASLFAAIGSSVENEGDAQQLQVPVTIPLMVAYIIALYAFKAPDSSIAFWGSMIPFTSPIVMIARLPFGVPAWELAVSIALLVVTFALCAWASAKIYKAGILMFGKKSTWSDLWKWLKQK